MAEILEFPVRGDWAEVDELTAQILQGQGLSELACRHVVSRVRAYREKYLNRAFSLEIKDLPPGAIEKVQKASQALQTQIREFTAAILIERISLEISLLAEDLGSQA